MTGRKKTTSKRGGIHVSESVAAQYPSKKPTAPKKPSMPKEPKASASPASWAKYRDNVNKKKAAYDQKVAEYNAQLALYNKGVELKKALKGHGKSVLAGL